MFITKKYLNTLIERLEGRFEKIDQRFESIEAKMATKDDLKSFATKDDLKSFATKEDIQGLKEKLATWMVEHFYTRDEIDSKFPDKEYVRRELNKLGIQFEALRSNFKAVGEGHRLLVAKTDQLQIKMDGMNETVEVLKVGVSVLYGKKPSNKNP